MFDRRPTLFMLLYNAHESLLCLTEQLIADQLFLCKYEQNQPTAS